MEYMKVILLLSFTVSCSLSHLTRPRPHNRQVGQNELNDCVCFPKQKGRQPVIAYLKPFGGEIKRTVIYVYTDIDNQSSVYIPNVEKQLLFPDLTFDEDDHVRSVAVELVDSLLSHQHDPIQQQHDTNYNIQSHSNHVLFDYIQNNQPKNTNTNSVIITHNGVIGNNNLDLQADKKRNEEAIKNIVNGNNNVHGGLVNNIIQLHQKKNNKDDDNSKQIHADLNIPQAPVDVNLNNNMLISSQIHSHEQGCSSGNCKQLVLDCGVNTCSKDYVSKFNAARPGSNEQKLDVVFNNIVKNDNSPQKIELGSHIAQNQVGENLSGKVYSIDEQASEHELIDWYVKQNTIKEQVTGENTHSQNYHQIIQKVYVPHQPHSVIAGQNKPGKVIGVHHDRPPHYVVVPPHVKNDKHHQREKNKVGLVRQVEENIPFLPFVSHTVNNLLDIIPNKFSINGGIGTSNKDGIQIGAGLDIKETSRDEDGVKIKIIGGHPAISSGTPLQIKA